MRVSSPWAALRSRLLWHEHSQIDSRRNALVASTRLAGRRREHVEVDQFLRNHLAAEASGDVSDAETG